jgi:response regulator RpfG family c-di-GMP phosphodiesterase
MSGERILIVDDEPSLCETLSDILEYHGYAVRTAGTGKAAEAILQSEPVDAALLDLRLPDRNGLEILRFIKDASPETEVLIVSGHATLSSAIEAMQFGAFGYVQKPVEVHEVLAGIERALERQRLARDLRRANAENRERVRELEFLLETTRAVSSRLELFEVLQILSEQMVRRGQVTLCCISVIEANRTDLAIHAVFPIKRVPWAQHMGEPIDLNRLPTHKRVIEEKQVSVLRRGDSSWSSTETEAGLIMPEGINSALLVPMLVKDRAVGVVTLLEARSWDRSPFTPRKVNLCQAMASGAAIAVENALLFEERERAHMATLRAMASALDARERETHAHSWRVQEYSLRLARAVDLPETEWKHLMAAALLHDIGKIGIPDGILLKAGKLTEKEWQEMRKHPLIGYEMLKGLAHLEAERAIVLAHHERWDGSGYPGRVSGTAIPAGARIFSVADALDAMTSDRPYRKRLSFAAAKEEIVRCSGTQFDPDVVTAFLSVPLEEWQAIREKAGDSREWEGRPEKRVSHPPRARAGRQK